MNNVLMYHSIGEAPNKEAGAGLYCVPAEKFRRQMEYLKAGTVPDTFGDGSLVRYSPVENRPQLLLKVTFDDGDITNYTHAYPILKELGLKAYFFITVSKIGALGYMSWEQARELGEAGMIIGSHGMSHRILTELQTCELDFELQMSKKLIESNLGCKVHCFSIPKGHYNKRIINKIKEAGYKTVFTSSPYDNDGFRIGRIPVRANWSFERFVKVVNNGLSFKDRAAELAKDSAKRMLGEKVYSYLRAKILR